MVDITLVVGKKWFVTSKIEKIEDYYDFDFEKDSLGRGTYGSVVKAISKEGRQPRAIKIIPKAKVKKPERLVTEIETLKSLDHPNIVRLFETFEDARNIYLVLELCVGGELFQRIIKQGHLTEVEAKDVFLQIMKAVYYCHSNGVAHRDLKPEHFLFLNDTFDSPLKIIDFGLSKIFGEPVTINKGKITMSTRVGTPYYIAPEVLEGEYDELCDIWSAGVILYILLCGYPPFYGENDAQIIQAVRIGEYDLEGPEWMGVSDSAKDLISRMICPAEKRLTAEQVLQHAWFQEKEISQSQGLKLNLKILSNFMNAEKLKKITLTYIATQLNENEILELNKLFTKLDKNYDGVLTFEEMKAGLEELNEKSAADLKEIMKSMDTDKNGTINYTEFIAASIERSLYLKEEKLWTAFRMFDKDGNGKISAAELKEVLGKDQKNSDMKYYDNLIKEADFNGDGEIDYNEFIKMMSSFH